MIASSQLLEAPEAGQLRAETAVPNPIRSSALARPQHPVLEGGGQVWSATDLLESVRRCAGRLAATGIEPGDVVALIGPSSPEWVIECHALGWIGAAVAPLSADATRAELEEALEALQPARVLVTHGLPPATRAMLHELAPEARYVNQLPTGPWPEERPWPLDEVRVVALTSGSSGRPRPIPLTTAQILFSAFGSAIRLGHHLDDRWLLCLPLHHVGGLSVLLRCAYYGTTVVLFDRFEPERVARTLDSGTISLVSLVPRMLERVLSARSPRQFPPTLRAILLGGDATPDALLSRCEQIGAPVAVTWGMTEAASQVATRFPGDVRQNAGCGAPLAFARVEVVDEGVLAVSGPLTREQVVTRDRGSIDPRGHVHVTGRDEEFLVSGGETVSLRELERVLLQHPELSDAGVTAVPDPRWGQRAVALVVPKHQQPPSPEALRTWLRARVSAAKLPREFVYCRELPRTSLGKLARGELLELVAQEGGANAAPSVLFGLSEVAREHDHGDLASRLVELRSWLDEDLAELERELTVTAKQIAREDRAVDDAAKHLLELPGKRLRPLCAILAARLGADASSDDLPAGVQDLALAAELVHAATLLHDDVIDEGRERRGKPTAWVVYGNSASVLAGDLLFAEALRRVSQVGDAEVMARLLRVIATMVDAEAVQLELRGSVRAEREKVLRVIQGKTAALFGWVLWGGGRLAGLPDAHCAALAAVGEALGIAFQLADDLLDLDGDQDETGKDVLADLRQGKLTWPFLIACERDPDLLADLRALVEQDQVTPGWLRGVHQRVVDSGAVEATRQLAREQARVARERLAPLPAGRVRDALETVIEAAVERSK